MYFSAYADQTLSVAWSDPEIVLSAADAVDTVNNLIPVQSSLTSQKLTINTAASFSKKLFIKGVNSGGKFGVVETNIIVLDQQTPGKSGINSDYVDIVYGSFWTGRPSKDYPLTAFNCSFGCEIEYLIISERFYKAVQVDQQKTLLYDEKFDSV